MSPLSEQLSIALKQHRIAGASIALSEGGQAHVAAAGYANVPEGIAATTDTVFQIGSITKAFTAALMSILVDDGLIAFDAPVSRYLPKLKIANAAPPDTLTIRALLDHSAGFEGDFFADFGPQPEALERYVAACADLQWIHAPGAMQSYNSAAYCIAGHVVEAVTGQFFNQALSERLLQPLGMDRYSFYDHEAARYRTAVGHSWDAANQRFKPPKSLRLPHCMSASGASLSMTATDLLRFGCLFVRRGRDSQGRTLISEATFSQIIDPKIYTPPFGKPLLMSWVVLETSSGSCYATSGQTIDQNAFLLVSPEHAFAAAILTNGAGAANQLFETVLIPSLRDRFGMEFQIPGSTPATAAKQRDREAGQNTGDHAIYAGTYVNKTRCDVASTPAGLTLTVSANSTTGGDIESEHFQLQQAGEHRFNVLAGDSPQPAGQLVFVFSQDARAKPDLLAMSNRLYRRSETMQAAG
ncbi:MAG: serine hydrolase domain-containing protein [Pseudomonadota bacterium]